MCGSIFGSKIHRDFFLNKLPNLVFMRVSRGWKVYPPLSARKQMQKATREVAFCICFLAERSRVLRTLLGRQGGRFAWLGLQAKPSPNRPSAVQWATAPRAEGVRCFHSPSFVRSFSQTSDN